MNDRAHVLVVADGEVDSEALVRLSAAPDGKPMVIAADGGAARCLSAGVRPDLVVGDLDSLPSDAQEALRKLGVEVRAVSVDKDESDTELCLLAALQHAATHITVLGALGIVRPEHSFANFLLLADPRFDGVELAIVGHGSRTWRIGTADGPGEAGIVGTAGDYVSLFALDPHVDGIHTEGLRFALQGATLPLGRPLGLSNELTADQGRVTSGRGRLLVVHTDRRAETGTRQDRTGGLT